MISPAMTRNRYDPKPLPQTFNGRFRAFLFSLGISLLCAIVGRASSGALLMKLVWKLR